MGILESISHTALSLNNTYTQGKALVFSGKEVNEDAAKAYLAKTMEEYFSGRIDGKQTVANGLNALVDYKLTTYLEEKGVPAVLAKAVGLAASSMAGSLAKGIADKLFTPQDTLDKAQKVLEENGRLPKADKSMGDRLISMLSGDSGGGVSAPLPAGAARGSQTATV